MASSSKGQRAAKRRRKVIRKLGIEQGRRRPIVVRHERGTTKKLQEAERQKRPVVVYQLVLNRGPHYIYQVDGWVSEIVRLCDKTYREADEIIARAMAYPEGVAANPPVLFSCTSMSDAKEWRLRFSTSVLQAIVIIEKAAG